MVDVVNNSADVNIAQLVGTQDGKVLVPTYSWASFLGEHFRKLPQIKSYHHFQFLASKPGVVTLKKFSDSSTSTFKLLHDDDWTPTADELPPVIHPPGLSNARQWYLYNQIREFCSTGTQDLVCPRPSGSPEEEPLEDNDITPEESDDESEPPRAKRVRRCGRCGAAGHNRRTCSATTQM